MRKALLFLLLLTAPAICSAALQDYCVIMSGGQGWSCSDHDPAETITIYLCEWTHDNQTGIDYYYPGDKVDLTVSSVHGAGYHPHETLPAFPLRPVPIWITGPYVSNSLQTVQGITGPNGCFSKTLAMTGYAGSYPITSFSYSGWPSYEHVIGAHYLKENKTGASRQMSYSSITMVDFSHHYDQFHNGNTFWVAGNTDNNFVELAVNYYALSFSNQQLEIVRGSLPEGGKSDNDPKGGSLPGLWDLSFRSWEDHSQMQAIDVVNPSLVVIGGVGIINPADPQEGLYADLYNASDGAGCSFGGFEPNSPSPVGVPATYDYWANSIYIHVVCGFEKVNLSPVCGLTGCPNLN